MIICSNSTSGTGGVGEVNQSNTSVGGGNDSGNGTSTSDQAKMELIILTGGCDHSLSLGHWLDGQS